MRMTLRTLLSVVGVASLLSACGADDTQPATTAADSVAEDMPGMRMPGMGDSGAVSGSSGMLDEMTQHMAMVRGLNADSMQRVLPMHRQLVANLIAQMNREMSDMKMTADAAWTATIDSVRADLRHMPELSAAELRASLSAHHDRVMRLIEQHRTMMRNMGM